MRLKAVIAVTAALTAFALEYVLLLTVVLVYLEQSRDFRNN
jgi:hypothetical protein